MSDPNRTPQSDPRPSILRLGLCAAFVTAVAWLLSYGLIYDISSLSVFSSMEKSVDFDISDIYNTVAQRRAVLRRSNDVVIVSVDECPSRTQIAAVIEAVDFLDPRAVGLDIFFRYPLPGDEVLVDVLRDCRHLVLPLDVQAEATAGSYFYDALPEACYGSINIGARTVRDVVREFKPRFPLAEGGTVGHLTSELARIADPEAYAALARRTAPTELIRFPSVVIPTISASELLTPEGGLQPDAAEQIAGRVVLIGNIFDASDQHLTPLESMSGLHIHAYTLQTILDGSYIRRSPAAWSWGIALAFCYLFVLGCLLMKRRGLRGDNLWARLIQLASVCLFLWVGCKAFVSGGYAIDFGPALVMTGLGTLALDLWMGVLDIADYYRASRRRPAEDAEP